MIDFGIYIIEPVLAAFSFWTISLSLDLILLPILGIVMNVIPAGPAVIFARRKFDDPFKEGSYVLSTVLSNRGVIGMLTVFALYGEPGYAVVMLMTLLTSPFVYMICFPIAEKYNQQGNHINDIKTSLLPLFFDWKQLPTLGLMVGIILNLSGLHRPTIAEDVFPYLVHLSAWLFLVPVGIAINLGELSTYWTKTIDLSLIKFLWTPLVVFAIVRVLHLDPVTSNAAVVLAMAPTAINAVITVKLFRLNISLAMAAFVMTTAVYLLVILPILFVVLS